MKLSIYLFMCYAKEKHYKIKNKFDKILFLYIISPAATKNVWERSSVGRATPF